MRPAPPGFEGRVVCAIWRELAAGDNGAGAEVAANVPANVYACINVLAEGEVRLAGTEGDSRLPPLSVCGPMTAPLPTRAVAPLRSLSVVLQPWLLRAWFAIEPATLRDAWAHSRRAPPLDDPAVAAALREAVDAPARLGDALRRIAALGNAVGSDEEMQRATALAAVLGSAQSVAAAAAQSGCSVREFERRFARSHGLSPRGWLKVRRFESSLVQLARDGSPLAALAADAGYADQAHMTREYRRAAGQTPARTRGAIEAEVAGYWAFRPAAEAAGLQPNAVASVQDEDERGA